MSVTNSPNIPEILSITQISKLLNLSRSRYYQLVSEGVFLPPIYSTDTKRPYYTAEMARKNLEVKKNSVGINGKIVLFYTSRNAPTTSVHKQRPKESKLLNNPTGDNHQDLIEGLSALGLSNVSDAQIESALKKVFPQGIENIDSGEILRQVFLSIKRQDSTDNVNR